MNGNYDTLAAAFCAAIKLLGSRPDNLDNLEGYLSYHFPTWLQKYAYDPETLTAELTEFATMDVGGGQA